MAQINRSFSKFSSFATTKSGSVGACTQVVTKAHPTCPSWSADAATCDPWAMNGASIMTSMVPRTAVKCPQGAMLKADVSDNGCVSRIRF
eukprot:CAMPEP_0174379966 /NCGR_PEP_ID=MMETSP0811_2-20130205/123057_1 /TAXON_ID=73025 ORGANISM="Eutreptiella gymnastica-like, Strain CCMP1594" /NCGR_SAMPLE_ID=MMETSP0811_2 /ASSEMBLY_ACC=CAM_ASM_000667 /LENGTH=89 /DNA_ID=CAMNT_0015532669 /DNA_START=38 /DNA_END=307 /DNA_ORIENTATION=-